MNKLKFDKETKGFYVEEGDKKISISKEDIYDAFLGTMEPSSVDYLYTVHIDDNGYYVEEVSGYKQYIDLSTIPNPLANLFKDFLDKRDSEKSERSTPYDTRMPLPVTKQVRIESKNGLYIEVEGLKYYLNNDDKKHIFYEDRSNTGSNPFHRHNVIIRDHDFRCALCKKYLIGRIDIRHVSALQEKK